MTCRRMAGSEPEGQRVFRAVQKGGVEAFEIGSVWDDANERKRVRERQECASID